MEPLRARADQQGTAAWGVGFFRRGLRAKQESRLQIAVKEDQLLNVQEQSPRVRLGFPEPCIGDQ